MRPLERIRREVRTRLRPSLMDDLRELAMLDVLERGPWKPRMHELWVDGQPLMLQGGLAGLEVNPQGANYPTITINATEAALVATANTPINAMQVSPKVYDLSVWGLATSAATPGTQTFNPRYGTSAAGASLGISSNLTPVASETATPWFLRGRMILRGGGTTTSTLSGVFEYNQGSAVSGGSAEQAGLIFGGTVSSSVDNTTAQALWLGCVAATSTTNTMTPQGVLWGSWN